MASASAREDALCSNRSGDYAGARSKIGKAIDLITVLKRDYPEAAAEVEALQDAMSTYSMQMDPMSAKRAKMASYEMRRSRVQR